MRPLAALLLSACSACLPASGSEAREASRQVEALHDLLALAPLGRLPGGTPLRHTDLTVDWLDRRDGMSFVRCPAGRSITFPPLAVHGVARLSVGCGSSLAPGAPGAPSGDPAVRFRVEGALVTPGDEGPRSFRLLAERALQRAAIEREGPLLLDLELPRPDAGSAAGGDAGVSPAGDPPPGAHWVLRFSTSAAGGDPAAVAWPAWVAPELRSEGRRVPLDLDPVLLEHTALHLVESFGAAGVLVAAQSADVTRGAIDPAPGSGTEESALLGGRRAGIVVRGTTRVRYLVTPRPGDRLQWAAGVDAAQGWELGGDGLRFAVEAEGQLLWERSLHPAAERADRGWHVAGCDLSGFAGREITVDLVTDAGPAGDAGADVGAWASARIARSRAVRRLPAGAAPTLVLVVVDTLRADRLGCYGRTGGLTPRLDALAARGTVFGAARSSASWTWPATASILTGLSPAEHGVHDSRHCLLKADFDTLAELCQQRGYTTGAFSANPLISAENGFGQGFESFALLPGATARALNRHAERWLEQTRGLARLLYVHYIDPHAPYGPPGSFRSAPGVPAAAARDEALLDAQLARSTSGGELPPQELAAEYLAAAEARYDAEVAYVDTAIGELLDALAAHGALDDALVVVTSDHGEEFLEHGRLGHGASLYEETVRVPLIAAAFGPRFTEGGGGPCPPGVHGGPVTTRDLLPTFIALAQLPAPTRALPGRALLPSGAAPPGTHFFAETLHGREAGVPDLVEKLSLFDGRWKLVSTPATARLELYDLQSDPRELDDLAAVEAERREALHAALRAGYPALTGKRGGRDAFEDADAVERLRSLGYLGR